MTAISICKYRRKNENNFIDKFSDCDSNGKSGTKLYIGCCQHFISPDSKIKNLNFKKS